MKIAVIQRFVSIKTYQFVQAIFVFISNYPLELPDESFGTINFLGKDKDYSKKIDDGE